MRYRNLRVANLIRNEISKIVGREMEFPGMLVTITAVEVDKKLAGANVKVSVIPSEKAEDAIQELAKKRGEFQHILARKLNIKPMPQIRFEIDRGPEKAAGVEKILLRE
jgi:ribosome-binding factor A